MIMNKWLRDPGAGFFSILLPILCDISSVLQLDAFLMLAFCGRIREFCMIHCFPAQKSITKYWIHYGKFKSNSAAHTHIQYVEEAVRHAEKSCRTISKVFTENYRFNWISNQTHKTKLQNRREYAASAGSNNISAKFTMVVQSLKCSVNVTWYCTVYTRHNTQYPVPYTRHNLTRGAFKQKLKLILKQCPNFRRAHSFIW